MRLTREEFNNKYKFSSQTPMMKQYLDVKFEHQDSYLLFRMGDFYELFFDDAIHISKILGIALAKRGKVDEESIPMCGVPYHALDNYLPKILERNLKVVICEQMESPEEAKKRDGHKAVVKRDVVRVITPGTVIEDSVLNTKRPNYLTSVTVEKQNISLAFLDITTGDFGVIKLGNISDLSALLDSYSPKEIIVSDDVFIKFKNILDEYSPKLVFQPDVFFSNKRASDHIEKFFDIKSVKSLGDLDNSSVSAIGAIIQYIKITQKQNVPKLSFPNVINLQFFMTLDPQTRKSLEITSSMSGSKGASLIDIIDETKTSVGARKLYSFLLNPLKNKKLILERQTYVQLFHENEKLLSSIRFILDNISDIERSLNKILMRRCSPVDVAVLKFSLIACADIKDLFYKEYGIKVLPEEVQNLINKLDFDFSLLDEICEKLADDVNSNMSDGGFIRPEAHPRLNELNDIITNSKLYINDIKEKYRKLTGIDNLKISHNNLLGLFVEVTQKNSPKITTDIFNYRQSTTNNVRFSTDELDKLHSEIVNASSMMLAIENEIFEGLCKKIDDNFEQLKIVSNTIAEIDVFSALAEIAVSNNYIMPEITDNGEIHIVGGKHPVVEHFLSKKQEKFTHNDCYFDKNQQIVLLTGPNMGGKSTYLRQNALIILLAQIGSYVPASKAKISVVDRIFSRVGSGDDLSTGKSTFMVEMIETAMILNQSTENSFIIFDEVGRGTSTYDGVSIAWSILEFLHDKKNTKTMFATHYQELTELAHTHKKLNNYSMSISEDNGDLTFLHKVVKGPISESYGINVAKIAGLPNEIIDRSKKVMTYFNKIFENKKSEKKRKDLYAQSMFDLTSNVKDKNNDELHNFIQNLSVARPDEMTPKMTHDYLEKIVEDAKKILQNN